MLLKDKNVVITGSGRGIGKEVAKACAKEGANIGLTARTLEEINKTKEEIENLGTGVKISVKTADITKIKEVEDVFNHFKDELGMIDGVIANAGASRMGNTHEFDDDRFANIINVNIIGIFNTFKAAYPFLKKDDKNHKAKFVITGSAAFLSPMPKFAAYTASKYAAVGLLKSLAIEYKKENINFIEILPTMVDTRMLRGRKAGDGNKPDNVMNPWDLNDYYIFALSDLANKIDNELIITSDIQDVMKIIQKAPADKKESWEVFKRYLEEVSPRLSNDVKKLGKLIEYLIKKSN
jgi:3-oxoacyl-[acyl-carrier protein] reductase